MGHNPAASLCLPATYTCPQILLAVALLLTICIGMCKPPHCAFSPAHTRVADLAGHPRDADFLLPVRTPAWPLLLTHSSARLAPAPQILLAIPVTLIFCGCIYGALSLQGNFAIWWLSYFMVRWF